MNTLEIERFLRRIPALRGRAWVRASDRLPSRIPPRAAVVANTVPHTEGGEHWVAFYAAEDPGRLEYFDSFGRPPYQADYQNFLRRNSRRYVYNRYRLQGYDTSVCGHYCLTYLYYRAVLGAGMNDFVQLFDPAATSANDALVRRLFDACFSS